MEWWGGPSQPVSFVLTTATFAFLFLERTERSGPPSSFMLPWSFASLQRHGVTEVGLPKISGRPSPTATHHSPPAAARPLTSPSFPLAWRSAWAPNSDLGGTSNRHRGEHSPQKGPESAGPSRAPLPPPARAAAAGASRARRPAGKMADGPGWLVTRGRCWKSEIPGPNLRLGMEAQTPSERTPRSITALGTEAACVPFNTSP